MLSVSNLGKSYGAQSLFAGMSIQFNAGSRYGVVGANGSGKSTLLRILTGEEEASEGSTSIPKRLRLGVLKQDHYRYEDELIIDTVMMGNRELWEAMAEREALLARADQGFEAERYAELEDLILRHDGYSQEARAGEILEGLGIATELHRKPLSVLSGGFKLRVLMAQSLASHPDALLLDEPTNHLDILSIRWLERFLEGFGGCVIVVSHDHRFLDNICTHIVDLDYGTAVLYPGNYSAFSEAKTEERERKEAGIARQEKKIAEQQAFVDRFRAKATKARQAQSRLKLIDRTEIERLAPTSRRYPKFRLEQQRPSGKKVLELGGIAKSFGPKRVLEQVSLEVMRGDRLAIIGPNGIGKSTLLKVIMGELEADAGSLEWGYEAAPGYFAQDHGALFANARADIESWLWDFCPGEPIGFVRARLGAALFSGDEVKKRVSSLSGGETARLVFCRLGILKPNVLLLDEPTNHLDLEAIEALVAGLESYEGTLIFVSHDRWFVSRLATRILELTPEGRRDFRGSYEEYLERCGDDHLDAEAVVLKVKRDKRKAEGEARVAERPRGGGKAADRERQAKLKVLERRRDEATRKVEEAEAHVAKIDERFCDPNCYVDTPADELRRLEQEREKLRLTIARTMDEWEAVEKELGVLGSDSLEGS